MSEDLDGLLERMVPGSGHRSPTDADAPAFPAGLDLQLVDVLARGSVGWVYRARDPVLDRVVAVKVSRPDGGAAARQALLDEARTTARLAHPAVLPVHAVRAADGLLCVVFALGPTTTLAARLADWRRAPEATWSSSRRLALLQTLADALARAHGLGITHGDLKPQNVALDDDGHPYVLDWGGLQADAGAFSGTPEYAAPEQLRGAAPTPAADVYALAAVAWEVLAGRPLRPARAGESVAAYIARHARDTGGASAPEGVEPELARILVRAASAAGDERPSAAEVRDALASTLTGRTERARREAEAGARLAEARRALLTFHERERRLEEEKRVIAVQRVKVPPHAPLGAKRALWAAQARALQLVDAQAETWTTALELAVAAANLVPGADEAHAIIAELWWERLRMAEERGYAGERLLARARVRAHDRGRFTDLMDASAHLTIPGPGTLELRRVVAEGPLLAEEPHETVALPVDHLALPAASWVLVVTRPGCPPVRVPVRLDRLEHLELDPRALSEVPDGWVPVLAGPFRMGGDDAARQPVDRCSPWVPDLLVRRTCVTSAEYLRFLQDAGPAHAPAEPLVTGARVPLWPDLALPEGWDPDWPVVGVSLADAQAFAAWEAERTGLAARLPTEEEWEKAARGADGRSFPWGEAFDPALCHMRDSVSGAPRPLAVGSFPHDVSPHGLRDVAGGVHEWTTSVWAGDRFVVRGGSWASDAQGCRLASRFGVTPDDRRSTLGFRLVADL